MFTTFSLSTSPMSQSSFTSTSSSSTSTERGSYLLIPILNAVSAYKKERIVRTGHADQLAEAAKNATSAQIYLLLQKRFREKNPLKDDSLDTILMIELIVLTNAMSRAAAASIVLQASLAEREKLREKAIAAFTLGSSRVWPTVPFVLPEKYLKDFCVEYLAQNEKNIFLRQHCVLVLDLQKQLEDFLIKKASANRFFNEEKTLFITFNLGNILKKTFLNCKLPREDSLIVQLSTFFIHYPYPNLPPLFCNLSSRLQPRLELSNEGFVSLFNHVNRYFELDIFYTYSVSVCCQVMVDAVLCTPKPALHSDSVMKILSESLRRCGDDIRYLSRFDPAILDNIVQLAPHVSASSLCEIYTQLTKMVHSGKGHNDRAEFCLALQACSRHEPSKADQVISAWISDIKESKDGLIDLSLFQLSLVTKRNWISILRGHYRGLWFCLSDKDFSRLQGCIDSSEEQIDSVTKQRLATQYLHSPVQEWSVLFESSDICLLEKIIAVLSLKNEVEAKRGDDEEEEIDLTYNRKVINVLSAIAFLKPEVRMQWQPRLSEALLLQWARTIDALTQGFSEQFESNMETLYYLAILHSIRPNLLSQAAVAAYIPSEKKLGIMHCLRVYLQQEMNDQKRCYNFSNVFAILDELMDIKDEEFVKNKKEFIKVTLIPAWLDFLWRKGDANDDLDLVNVLVKLIQDKEENYVKTILSERLTKAFFGGLEGHKYFLVRLVMLLPLQEEIFLSHINRYFDYFINTIMSPNMEKSKVEFHYKTLTVLFRNAPVDDIYLIKAKKVFELLVKNLERNIEREIFGANFLFQQLLNLIVSIIVHAGDHSECLLKEFSRCESNFVRINHIMAILFFHVRLRVIEILQPELHEVADINAILAEKAAFPNDISGLVAQYLYPPADDRAEAKNCLVARRRF